MRLCISSGHGKLIRGAAGPSPWGLDEVNEARKVVDRVAEILRGNNNSVTVLHDDVSTSQNANLNWIVNHHNNAPAHDWDVSVHFNAYQVTTTKPMGSEVLYVSSAGEDMADAVVDKICENGFVNRGPKKRTDLAFLNGTAMPAVLLECCFVDSKPDADLYRAKFEDICHDIAEGLVGHSIGAPGEPDVPPPDIDVEAPAGVHKSPDIMMRLIRDFKMQDFHAAGVMGNIGHECAWFTIWQEQAHEPPEGGWGWCQWTGSRREDFYAWIEEQGYGDKSDDGNYGFLAHELKTTEKAALEALLETENVREATECFMLKFERPGTPHLDRRQVCARQATVEWHLRYQLW